MEMGILNKGLLKKKQKNISICSSCNLTWLFYFEIEITRFRLQAMNSLSPYLNSEADVYEWVSELSHSVITLCFS